MKNKISVVAILAFMLVFGVSVSAANKNVNGSQNQTGQQTQTVNQGEKSQIQIKNNEQTQSGTNNQIGTGSQVKTQQQTQQKLQDGSGEAEQVQNQNQIKNQGETNKIQNQEEEKNQTKGSEGLQIAEQRRSKVANAVQEMLQVADRNGGIGQQVKTIAQTQNQNLEKLEDSLQKIQSRSGFVKFFLGPNFGEINNAMKLLEQNREQIQELNRIKTQLINQGDAQLLAEQIQLLEKANWEIENLLNTAQRGFSLFGWMFRLFAK